MVNMGNTRYGLLGQEIYRHMKRMKWKQRDLADKAEIAQSTISKIMRDEHRASPDTLDAIGRALGVDSTYLMRLAGIPLPKERTKRHPKVEYIAQQLDKLDPRVQESLITAIGAQIEAVNAAQQITTSLANDPPKRPGVQAPLEPDPVTQDPIYDEDPIQAQVANIYALVREFRRVFPKEYEEIKARL